MRLLGRIALASTLSLAALACASRVDIPERPRRVPNGAAGVPGLPAADPNSVAAEVVGKKLTLGELDATIADQLQSARTTYEMALYEARKGALDRRIEDELLRAEAGKRGISVDALKKAEVDDKVSAPSEAEVAAFYEQFKDRMEGASLEEIAPRIREHLSQERQGGRYRDFMAGLRKAHGVKLLLEPPRTDVEAKGPSRGPDAAKVTIVIFSDFECPFCARAEPTLAQIRQTWPNDVRFVFRNYPLPFHNSARPAAAAAICAGEQGRFWELHDHLFESGELEPTQTRTWLGQQTGFDLGKYDDCLSSGRGDKVIADDMEAAAAVGVDSTPHFFVNGVRVSGAQPFDAFESIISAELAR